MNQRKICQALIKKNHLNKLLLMLLLWIPQSVLSDTPRAIDKTTVQATIIHFSEFEQGSGVYPVSMTISTDFLRIDDTVEGKDFILFDRNSKEIFSVNSEEQQIIKIRQTPVTIKSPMELKLHEIELDMDDNAPLIAGKKARHFQFFVNDKLCYDLISVPNLLPDAVAALKDFKQVLAGQQSETLRAVPGDLHEACDLARHIFYPQRHLEKGFPIIEKESGHGQAMIAPDSQAEIKYSRALTNFKEEAVSTERFVLPEYRIVPIN